jgi:hypothetical protein
MPEVTATKGITLMHNKYIKIQAITCSAHEKRFVQRYCKLLSEAAEAKACHVPSTILELYL